MSVIVQGEPLWQTTPVVEDTKRLRTLRLRILNRIVMSVWSDY